MPDLQIFQLNGAVEDTTPVGSDAIGLQETAIGGTTKYALLSKVIPYLFTDAGDILYATGLRAGARLGIGTALDIMQTNAGATAPEWVALPVASLTVKGRVEIATDAEINTGTDAGRAIAPAGFQTSKRNIRYLVFSVVASDADVEVAASIGGRFKIPFACEILQSDTFKDQLSAELDTPGTTGTMVADIHLNGTTIMDTNKLDIETAEDGTTTASTQPDLTTNPTPISAGDILTFHVDTIHTVAGKGLKFYVAVRES